jgi:hypothetical protein
VARDNEIWDGNRENTEQLKHEAIHRAMADRSDASPVHHGRTCRHCPWCTRPSGTRSTLPAPPEPRSAPPRLPLFCACSWPHGPPGQCGPLFSPRSNYLHPQVQHSLTEGCTLFVNSNRRDLSIKGVGQASTLTLSIQRAHILFKIPAQALIVHKLAGHPIMWCSRDAVLL